MVEGFVILQLEHKTIYSQSDHQRLSRVLHKIIHQPNFCAVQPGLLGHVLHIANNSQEIPVSTISHTNVWQGPRIMLQDLYLDILSIRSAYHAGIMHFYRIYGIKSIKLSPAKIKAYADRSHRYRRITCILGINVFELNR